MVTRSTVRDGSLNEITPCPMLHGETPVHYQGMTTTPPVAPCTSSAEPSSAPLPRRQSSMALGSIWPKSLTLPTLRGHMDLVRKILIGNQLRLLAISCLLYPLPFIYLELNFSLL